MFLRRVWTQLANQDWPAVIIELFVVAVGIFLGLQASNWNDDLAERALERGYLIRLHEDMLASATGLELDNEFLEKQLSDQEIVLAALDSCQLAAEDELAMQRGIGTLGYLNSPRLFRRTFDELAASGRMDIIQNENIKAELARIVAEVEWRESVMESVFRQVDYHRVRFDEQVKYDTSRPLKGSTSAVAVEFDLQLLCKLPRNAAAVSAISLKTRERLIAFRELLGQYRTFLPLLESELETRWSHVVERE
ncbi:MAG: hypothetical protein P8X81_09535 [Woeseiaceae bacterium]